MPNGTRSTRMVRGSTALLAIVTLAACGGGGAGDAAPPSAFALRFAATAAGRTVGCSDTITGLGPDGSYAVGISDLRFYVSNLRFFDASGRPVERTLDANPFQLAMPAGEVGLIDLTGNTEGTCSGTAIAFAEGTARTNDAITGTTQVERVTTVSFDVGVPQRVMRDVIADNTLEGAPTPLAEMYWSWASGYRHLVFNMTVRTSGGDTGEGYLHVGSRDCGPEGGRALSDRDACGFVNTPKVELAGFDLTRDTVQIDLGEILRGLDFVSPIHDGETSAVIGEGPGVACHSSPPSLQPDCAELFANLGLSTADGSASAAGNHVFSAR